MSEDIVVVIPDSDWLAERGGLLMVFPFYAEGNSDGSILALKAKDVFDRPEHSARDFQVIWLLPSALISSCKITRPAGFSEKYRNSLPFLVEGEIIHDIHSQHFAYKDAGDGNLALHILDNSIMERVLAGAAESKLTPDWIIADADLLQDEIDEAVILVGAQYCRFQYGASQVCMPVARLELLFEMASSVGPERIKVIRTADYDGVNAASFDKYSFQTVEVFDDKSENGYLAYRAAKIYSSANNLLQGCYRSHESHGRWRKMSWGVGIFGSVFLFLGLYFFILSAQLDRKTERLKEALFADVEYYVPGLYKGRNLKALIEGRIKKNTKAASALHGFSKGVGAFFLAWQSMDGMENARVGAIGYSRGSGELLVEVENIKIESVDRFQKQLLMEGVNAQVISARSGEARDGLAAVRLKLIVFDGDGGL
jgi:type II secretory pathway component PulL